MRICTTEECKACTAWWHEVKHTEPNCNLPLCLTVPIPERGQEKKDVKS